MRAINFFFSTIRTWWNSWHHSFYKLVKDSARRTSFNWNWNFTLVFLTNYWKFSKRPWYLRKTKFNDESNASLFKLLRPIFFFILRLILLHWKKYVRIRNFFIWFQIKVRKSQKNHGIKSTIIKSSWEC